MSNISSEFENFFFSVFIRCGRNFENKKWLESNSPYVEITIGDETKRTSKLPNLSNPSWNETLKFKLNGAQNLPSFIKFVVKDDRTLFPTAELGDYTFNLENDKLIKYQTQKEMIPFCTLYDGLINLNNAERATLDVKILFGCGDCNWLSQNKERPTKELNIDEYGKENEVKYEEVKKTEYEKIPDIALQRNEVEDTKLDEEKYKSMDQNEVHVLPTLKLKEKPTIVEKEVEYVKPVEVKETIIHQEKPIIVEQPIIKEKHEHYREAPNYEKKSETVVTERTHEEDVGNLDQEQLRALREQRKQEFNDTTPIIEHEKKHVELETDVREKPADIREKEVIYQQPIEIEKKNIEKIQPKVREDVLVEKEHVYQKVEPEIQSENVQHVYQDSQFYSKETDNNLKVNTNNQNQQSSQVM